MIVLLLGYALKNICKAGKSEKSTIIAQKRAFLSIHLAFDGEVDQIKIPSNRHFVAPKICNLQKM